MCYFLWSKYCSQLRICALLRYGLCWQGSADAIFMTFSPLQCVRSARRTSLSLISIAIQMLTFKATSHTGLGAGLQISEGTGWTAEAEEVDDREARRSAYVLRRRLGNPAKLSLTSTSHPPLSLLNELPEDSAGKASGFSRLLESRVVPSPPSGVCVCLLTHSWTPPCPRPWVNSLLPVRPFLSASSPVLAMIQFRHHR